MRKKTKEKKKSLLIKSEERALGTTKLIRMRDLYELNNL